MKTIFKSILFATIVGSVFQAVFAENTEVDYEAGIAALEAIGITENKESLTNTKEEFYNTLLFSNARFGVGSSIIFKGKVRSEIGIEIEGYTYSGFICVVEEMVHGILKKKEIRCIVHYMSLDRERYRGPPICGLGYEGEQLFYVDKLNTPWDYGIEKLPADVYFLNNYVPVDWKSRVEIHKEEFLSKVTITTKNMELEQDLGGNE